MPTLDANINTRSKGKTEDVLVVGKFSHFGIINANNFALFRCTETETRDKVHDPQNDGLRQSSVRQFSRQVGGNTYGHDKRVSKAGNRVGYLVSELDPVVIDPSTSDNAKSVQSSNLLLSEKGGENVSDHAANSVTGKDIKAIVIAEQKLELGGEVACSSGNNTKCDGCWGTNESRGWGNGDEATDGTRAESNNGPFAFKAVILYNGEFRDV